MKIEVKQKLTDMEMDKVNVIIESKNGTEDKFEEYIKNYNGKIAVIEENRVKSVLLRDVVKFYCDYKTNYCKTMDNTYVIRRPLYELEEIGTSFVRTSKKTIVNTDYITEFGETGIGGFIILKHMDGTEERVARRRKKKVQRFLKERSI